VVHKQCLRDEVRPRGAQDYGRDHHLRAFTIWLAGAGIKPGVSFGTADDYSYNIVDDPIHIHDLNATILHSLRIDHTRLTYRHQGRPLPPDRRARRGHQEAVRIASAFRCAKRSASKTRRCEN
jgi:hypothetical protein